MHEDVFAGLRGDEAKALLGVEPLHGSNSHVLVPPSIVLEVSTNADATLAPTARDKLDLQVAKQNVNLCRAHGSGCGHCPLPNPGLEMLLLGCGSRDASRGRRGGRGDRFSGYRRMTVHVRVRVTPSTAWMRETT